jgi:hypothetical protein
MAQKRVAKKLEVTETTTHEASSSSRSSLSSRVLIMEYCMLTVDFGVFTGHSIVQPRGSWGEDNWDIVGGATERSLSPAPAVEETVPEMAQQATGTVEPRASA